MKTWPCMLAALVKSKFLEQCLVFFFSAIAVIGIALHYDSYHHGTAIVYFYVLPLDCELLQGKD